MNGWMVGREGQRNGGRDEWMDKWMVELRQGAREGITRLRRTKSDIGPAIDHIFRPQLSKLQTLLEPMADHSRREYLGIYIAPCF